MTIPVDTEREDYTGTGTTDQYDYGFIIYNSSDLQVTKANTLGVETTLTDGVDYTVSGIGAPEGGHIILTAGNLPLNYHLTMVPNIPFSQETNLRNQGKYFPSVVERQFDRCVRLCKQLLGILDRSIKVPISEVLPVGGIVLPSVVDRALRYLAFNAAGIPIATSGAPNSVVPVSVFMETLLDDTDALTARATLGIGEQFIWAGTATGTGNALVLTPAVPATSLAAGLAVSFKSSAAPNSGATTVAVSGLTAKAIQNAGTACQGAEIEASKWYIIVYDGAAFQLFSIAPAILMSLFTAIGDIAVASASGKAIRKAVGADGQVLMGDSTASGGVSYAVRNLERSQCPLNGSVDTNGLANFLTTGAGLRPGLEANPTPLLIGFGAGYDAGGNIDFTSLLSADVADIIGADLAASNTSFIFADRTSPTAVTWGKTVAPPQARETYDRTKQAVLQFAGAAGATTFLDDFGNTWTAFGGAKVQTNQFKFGTGGLGGAGAANAMNGTDYVKTTDITSFGIGGWAVRGWVYATALPGAGAAARFVGAEGAVNAGNELMIYNNAGTIKFAYSLSSNSTTSDIVSLQQGTTTPVINTWYFVELTFDFLAGVYRLYVGGVQEATTVSTLKCCTFANGLAFGAENGGTAGHVGYLDKFEFLPYCQHPAGTSYAGSLPSAAPDVTAAGYASEYYDIVKRKLFGITAASAAAAANPTFTAKTRTYVGECDTSGAAITAARSYAYKGRVNTASAVLAAATNTFTHNIGSLPRQTRVIMTCIINDSGTFFPIGDDLGEFTGTIAGAANANGYSTQHKRNSSALIVSATTMYLMTGPTGTIGSPNNYNHFLARFYVDRGW